LQQVRRMSKFALRGMGLRPDWRLALTAATLVLGLGSPSPFVTDASAASGKGTRVRPETEARGYPDGRPAAAYRLEAVDEGVVFRHGQGPGHCDEFGARDVWAWEHKGNYYLHYDGAGSKGWLTCLAESRDLRRWTALGPVLALGEDKADDSASASYGTTYFDGGQWHMFYLGTPHTSAPPDLVPAFPYLTMKAEGDSPTGPWLKRYDITPFKAKPGSYYSSCASPGFIVKNAGEYLMFFSASTDNPILRTLSLAHTRDLNGGWLLEPQPLLPATEQIENSSMYYEPESRTWFLFTNHVGLKDGLEYTDAVWVYWSRELTRWNPAHKAVVLDSRNCKWSKQIIGLPSVVRYNGRLALFYDGNSEARMPAGVKSHMNRDIGLAWLDLPLVPPSGK